MIFDWLDVEGRGTVSFAEFCEGLDCLKETVTGRRLLNVDCGVKRQCCLVQQVVSRTSDEVAMLRRDMVIRHAQLMGRIQAVLDPDPEKLCQSSPRSPSNRSLGSGQNDSSTSPASPERLSTSDPTRFDTEEAVLPANLPEGARQKRPRSQKTAQ